MPPSSPTSNTCATFWWFNDAASRASSRNICTAIASFARSGVISFNTTWRSKLPMPVVRAM